MYFLWRWYRLCHCSCVIGQLKSAENRSTVNIPKPISVVGRQTNSTSVSNCKFSCLRIGIGQSECAMLFAVTYDTSQVEIIWPSTIGWNFIMSLDCEVTLSERLPPFVPVWCDDIGSNDREHCFYCQSSRKIVVFDCHRRRQRGWTRAKNRRFVIDVIRDGAVGLPCYREAVKQFRRLPHFPDEVVVWIRLASDMTELSCHRLLLFFYYNFLPLILSSQGLRC